MVSGDTMYGDSGGKDEATSTTGPLRDDTTTLASSVVEDGGPSAEAFEGGIHPDIIEGPGMYFMGASSTVGGGSCAKRRP